MARKAWVRRFGKVLMFVGLALVLAAGGLLGYNAYEDVTITAASEEVLQEVDAAIAAAQDAEESAETVPYAEDEATVDVVWVDGRAYIGTIEIPAIGVDLPIQETWSSANLKISPCVYSGSVQNGDLVVCGHSINGHFRKLRQLREGDEVILRLADGSEVDYEIDAIETLDRYEVDRMVSSDWELSLYTCTYSGLGRITVRCHLAE